MLICNPKSFFSWSFEITGSTRGAASVDFDIFGESGTITHAETPYRVQKQGWLSGTWSVSSGSEVLATAVKPSAWTRAFEISSMDTPLLVKAGSPLGRSYEMISGGRVIGTISPTHPFTRRSTIACEDQIPELIQLFSFWLAVMTWRRSRQANSSSAQPN